MQISETTKQFLKYRINAEYIEEVKQQPNSNYHTKGCEKMSAEEAKRTSGSVVNGWLVTDTIANWYCPIKRKGINAIPIIRHCWNINKNGIIYDTANWPSVNKDLKTFQYVMDPDSEVCYRIGEKFNKFIPQVMFITNTDLMLQIKDGTRHTITREEHNQFYNECKGTYAKIK
jgi:hypothetical protein|tara:strand:+ start:621 stop:1139 length:519 start_codon:yes stop_codon:yes gene_type:complete